MASGGELYDMALAAGFLDALVTAYDKKHPISDWKRFEDHHLTEVERAEQRALAERTVNPGFWSPTGGPHGIVAADPDDAGAMRALKEMVGEELLERTASERTPGGGYHVIFSVPENDRTPNNGPAGVGGITSLHFRGYGGGIKHWPSAGYVMKRFPVDGLELLPVALRQALEERSSDGDGHHKRVPPSGGAIREGQRNETLFRNASAMQRRGIAEEAIRAAMHRDNEERGDPKLPADEVDRIVDNVLGRYEPLGTPAEPFKLTELGNAERMRHRHAHELLPCAAAACRATTHARDLHERPRRPGALCQGDGAQHLRRGGRRCPDEAIRKALAEHATPKRVQAGDRRHAGAGRVGGVARGRGRRLRRRPRSPQCRATASSTCVAASCTSTRPTTA